MVISLEMEYIMHMQMDTSLIQLSSCLNRDKHIPLPSSVVHLCTPHPNIVMFYNIKAEKQ